ncbi:MAG: DUF262 domain-containing HNH endonuclease family protein [Pseudomonadota bacterium]
MASLTARERTLSQLFTKSYRFRIPYFQRPYAWTEEEAGTLLSDLSTAAANAPQDMSQASPYFLGSIVIVQSPGQAEASVVDGQQRLTTATILLSVMRDLDIALLARLQPHILFSGENSGPLTPRAADVEFFRDHFQKPQGTKALTEADMLANPAQEKMVANALHMRHELEMMTPAERKRLADFILERCILVEVKTADENGAYQVFEVMNSRGLDLKETDVLKAELIGAMPSDIQSIYADHWEDLEAALGDEAFFNLFGHIRMIHRPGKASKSMIAEVRETMDPVSDPQGFIEKTLLAYGRVFQELITSNMRMPSRSEDANRLLRPLNRLTNRDWVAPAIAFFVQTNRNADDAIAFLRALERMAYALFIQSAQPNMRTQRYGDLIKAIRKDASVAELCDMLEPSHNDKKTCRSVLDGPIYTKEHIRRIVLIRLDERLSDRGMDYDLSSVTVEHVLPQNPPPNSSWVRLFPDKRRREKLASRLGNLTLLPKRTNNKAGNYDFETKKSRYLAKGGVTPFALTSQILLEPVWSEDAITRRQTKLFDLACETWGF